MTGLELLFAIRDGGTIAAQETTVVDAALLAAHPSQIPADQVPNVCEYINAHLVYNQEAIPADQKAGLEYLLTQLESRR